MTATPLWLARHPYSLALLMRWCNAWRRSRALRVAVVVAVAVLVGLASWPAAGAVGIAVSEHAPALFGAGVVLFATLTVRLRRRAQGERVGSWLAALPVASSAVVRAALRATPALLALELLLCAVLVAGRPPVRAAAMASIVLAAGSFAGFWAGWFLLRPQRDRTPPSRRAITRRPRAGWASHPTLAPLGFWAAALTRWWTRPKVSARWEALVLLSLPMGIAGATALAIAGAGLVLVYLACCQLAIARVAFAGSWWLGPTPVGAVRYAASVSALSLLKQATICALLLFAIDALGAAPALRTGIAAAIGWMLWCTLVSGMACAYALRHAAIAESRLHRWFA